MHSFSLCLSVFSSSYFLKNYLLLFFIFISGCAGSLLLYEFFSSWGNSPVAVRELLTVVASLLLSVVGSRHTGSIAAASEI